MKASPPPDPVQGETPIFPAPAVEPAAAAPAVEPPPVPQPARTATWPEWFGAVDFALVIMAVVAAFLIASFAAKNSDLWLQLANGRHIAEGTYSPGSDPFSFSGADRAWADTSWLHNLVQYALYSVNPNGQALVAVKAAVVAAAFGLLFLLRRPGHSFWPWALFAFLGVVASAPYLSAQPHIWSMLFLAVTLLVIYRATWSPGSWRQPLTIAGLFALWVNCDQWFLLGPLTLALVLVGESVQRAIGRGTSDEAFPAAPPPGLLGRALVCGVVACLLNPMLLAALAKDPATALGQLVPAELGAGLPAGVATDAELRVLTGSPLRSEDYFIFHPGRVDEQVKLPSVALALFVVTTALALALGFAQLRIAHLLLWLAFAALALVHGRLVPFFVIVATPLAAAAVNGLSARIRLGAWTATPTRLALTGSALGRLFTVVLALLILGAMYPGWLHNPTTDPGNANRLEWVVSPEPGMVRAAVETARLREDLPDDVRGLNLSPAYGNYVAWYAPRERVFVNSRYAFHRPELEDLIAVRHALIGRELNSELPDLHEVERVSEARQTGYLSYASQSMLDGIAVGTLLQQEARWALWHLDGRLAVFGRRAGVDSTVSDRLRYNPVRLAFGPDVEPLPRGQALQPLKSHDDPWDAFWASYLTRPERIPPEVDDVRILDGLNDYYTYRATIHTQVLIQVRLLALAAANPIPYTLPLQPPTAPVVDDDQLALSVILTRRAWRAVAAAPDRPEVYHALATAYNQPYSPTSNLPLAMVQMTEQQLQLLTALARYLARAPAPEQCTVAQAKESLHAARQLYSIYRQTGQLDLALQVFERAVRLAELLPPQELFEFIPANFLNTKRENPIQDYIKGMKDQLGELARVVQQQTDFVNRQSTPLARFVAAARDFPPKQPVGRLPGLAIELFKTGNPNDFGTGEDQLNVVFDLIAMELRAGHLENAADDLATIEEVIKNMTTMQPGNQASAILRILQGIQARLVGDFAAATNYLPRPPQELDQEGRDFAREILGLPMDYARVGNPEAENVLGSVLGSTSSLHARSFVVRQMLMNEMTYQLERAMLAFCDGDIPEAQRRLEQAAKPQGLDLAKVGDVERLGLINRYLDMIRAAQAPPDQP